MKNILILLSFSIIINGYSQTFIEALNSSGGVPPSANVNGTDNYDNLVGNQYEWSKIMGVLAQFDDIDLEKRNIKGSVYLFKTWENDATIVIGKKSYRFNNINFHIEKGDFMSKIEKDSTLIFDQHRFNKIVINNRQFKSIYTPNLLANKVYEIVYESKNISLLKNHSVSFVERSRNPMVNRPQSTIKKKSNYFVLKNNQLSNFKLNKTNALELVSQNQKKELKNYIKKNRLSFKREKDLKAIFKYLDILTNL